MQDKIAIIGDGESITVFKAAGVAAFPAENEQNARDIIQHHRQIYP